MSIKAVGDMTNYMKGVTMDRIDLFTAAIVSMNRDVSEGSVRSAVENAIKMAEWVDKAKKKIEEERIAAEAERLEKEAAIKAAWEAFLSRTREVAEGWEHLTVEGRRRAFIQFVRGMHDHGCEDWDKNALAVAAFNSHNLKEAVGLFPEERHIIRNFISGYQDERRSAFWKFLDCMDRNNINQMGAK